METIIYLLLGAIAYLLVSNAILSVRLRKLNRNVIDIEDELYKEGDRFKSLLEDFKGQILYAVNNSQLAEFAYNDILTLNAKVEELEKIVTSGSSGISKINTEQYELSKPLITKITEGE